MKTQLIIAIDGPSASGKGTLAKKIARHFNLAYLNTGALYRLVAFRMQNQKISTELFLENISQLVKNITEAELENEELFSEEVGALASVIAREKKLREALVVFQKDFIKAGENGVVLDGRDTTTVICPDADFKFFVTADVEIRAKRRFEQLQKKGDSVSFEEILAQLKKRDENDLNRQDSPLKVAQGAVVIDNGNLTIEQGFEIMLASVTG
jgi:cytidylate kinase